LLTTVIAFTGGLLGILFMIPMRRVFVVSDDEDLKYPEGVASAIFKGAGLGALFKQFRRFASINQL
jgi:uncharacterized oligopeptide transporter (OPT) family protein